ncbi:hypothetical protein EMCRGX_G028270 [Ephydatia muelleri]
MRPAAIDPVQKCVGCKGRRPGPFVYFPFSVGHRSCIGCHFAMGTTGFDHTPS